MTPPQDLSFCDDLAQHYTQVRMPPALLFTSPGDLLVPV